VLGIFGGLAVLATYIIWEILCGVIVFNSTSSSYTGNPPSNYCDPSLTIAANFFLSINYILWSIALLLICLHIFYSWTGIHSQEHRGPVDVATPTMANNRLPPIARPKVKKSSTDE
jgi:hypothetical protein